MCLSCFPHVRIFIEVLISVGSVHVDVLFYGYVYFVLWHAFIQVYIILVVSEVVLSKVHMDLTHAQMVVLTSGSIIELERVMSVTCRLVAGKEMCIYYRYLWV